jgi:hypothetical protein
MASFRGLLATHRSADGGGGPWRDVRRSQLIERIRPYVVQLPADPATSKEAAAAAAALRSWTHQ